MSARQPNIVVFFWDNFGWGEVGCYGGGVLRGAPTPRIDELAAEGTRLLNFNVEAQCTPSRSALLTGRHPIRSGTHSVPVAGGADGLTRWEVTIAQALSDAGYATGMWGKWHLGSDPERRSPVDFGFDEAVWSPRTADEVLWTMQSYFPTEPVTATPYGGDVRIRLAPQTIYSRSKGSGPEAVSTYDADFRATFDRRITDWASDFMRRSHAEGKPFYAYLPYTQVHIPPIPDPEYAGATARGNIADLLVQMDDSPVASSTSSTTWGSPTTRSSSGPPTTAPTPTTATRLATPIRSAASGPGSRAPGAARTSLRWRAPHAPPASSAGRATCPRGG
jgi:arylsulfatase